MSTENILSLISIISSLLLSGVSLWIALSSLRLTKKSIEDANRPYITIFYERVEITKITTHFLVIKNFGKSGAVIKNISFYPDIEDNLLVSDQPFCNYQNVYIAPNQSFTSSLSSNKTSLQNVICTIEYEYMDKVYKEQTNLNFASYTRNNHSTPVPPKSIELPEILSRIAAELFRRNF